VSRDGPKPGWLKKPIPEVAGLRRMEALLRDKGLHTVCESALCPNRGECFAEGTATFLIMGDVCTRDCGFCGVAGGKPAPLDPAEPERVADAVASLGLSHAVVTSVTRDDLAEGGAAHFVDTMRAIRRAAPGVTIEVLVSDFHRSPEGLDAVLAEAPEVFNHNIETVERLYPVARPQAGYNRSLAVLARATGEGRSVVKTGFMVGLGETGAEVQTLLADVAEVGAAVVTIGQYLRPSKRHLPVVEYVHPEAFTIYKDWGEGLGLQIHAGPFVRSSLHARASYARASSRLSPYSPCDAEIQ
jgi:lipoic acid synthetase